MIDILHQARSGELTQLILLTKGALAKIFQVSDGAHVAVEISRRPWQQESIPGRRSIGGGRGLGACRGGIGLGGFGLAGFAHEWRCDVT